MDFNMKEIKIRHGVGNSQNVFIRKKQGRVAFIGGSITEMARGYSYLASQLLTELYPECKFDFINAGISSTCSNTGSFRIGRDVFAKGKTDLLFIEFAVNDNQDGHLKPSATIRAMEGMVRQAYRNNPDIDIVFLYTANESHNATYAAGKIPREIRAMEKVARYYHIPSVNFAANVAQRLKNGEFDWLKDFGGVHPAPFGNEIYCSLIKELINKTYRKRKSCIPAEKIDKKSTVNGTFISPAEAVFDKNWTFGIPDWDILDGEKRDRFTSVPTLFSETPGAEFSLDFCGNCIGLYLTAGPDAGEIEFSIDGTPFKKADLYHPFSKALHYPYTKMLAEDLSSGKHVLTVRIAETKNPSSSGNAVRIMDFAVNTRQK